MIDGALIGMVAGGISFAAYSLYIFTTLLGRTKPSRATWWILTLVGTLIAASYYAEGARDTIWIALSYVLGPAIIAVLSLKFGEGKWEKLDVICLTGAIISAVIWVLSSSALVVLLINILMDFLGLIPTIKKSYLRPEGEDRVAWTMAFSASFLNLFAIDKWIFSIWIYPIYLFVINGYVAILTWRKRKK